MAIFTWYNGEVPTNLEVTQVYGVVFTEEGRILMKVEEKSKGKIIIISCHFYCMLQKTVNYILIY